jgi:hypothetical protein
LQRIENKQKIQDAQPGKPTLRTRTDTQAQGTGQADPGATGSDGSDDPDRPVLKKRTDSPDSNDPSNTSGSSTSGTGTSGTGSSGTGTSGTGTSGTSSNTPTLGPIN